MSSNHLIKIEWVLDPSIKVEIEKEDLTEKVFYLKFKKGNRFKLSCSHLKYNYIPETHTIELLYLKKWCHKALPVITTWSNAIKKYLKCPLFVYTVTPLYKHFPIILNLSDDILEIKNYLGLKTSFFYKIDGAQSMELKNKKLYVRSYDDVLMGSKLNNLKTIRYKTNHSKMDRRIITDGILIQKEIVYEQ